MSWQCRLLKLIGMHCQISLKSVASKDIFSVYQIDQIVYVSILLYSSLWTGLETPHIWKVFKEQNWVICTCQIYCHYFHSNITTTCNRWRYLKCPIGPFSYLETKCFFIIVFCLSLAADALITLTTTRSMKRNMTEESINQYGLVWSGLCWIYFTLFVYIYMHCWKNKGHEIIKEVGFIK